MEADHCGQPERADRAERDHDVDAEEDGGEQRDDAEEADLERGHQRCSIHSSSAAIGIMVSAMASSSELDGKQHDADEHDKFHRPEREYHRSPFLFVERIGLGGEDPGGVGAPAEERRAGRSCRRC